MYKFNHHIVIGGYSFSAVKSIKFSRSIHTIASECVLKTAKTATIKKKDTTELNIPVTSVILPGMYAEISFGYGNSLHQEFTGYVKSVLPGKIVLMNEIYQLERKTIKKSYKDTRLKDILTDIVTNTDLKLDLDTDDINVKSLNLHDNGSAISRFEALKKIKDAYKLSIFVLSKGLLFVGLTYKKRSKLVKIGIDYNTIKDNLTYVHSINKKTEVTAISHLKDGSKIEQTVGDSGGDKLTIHVSGVESKSKLKEIAQNEIDKHSYDGYSGKFTCLGLPRIDITDVVGLSNQSFVRPEGLYYCESIKKQYGPSGIRQDAEIGIKL
ncbi:MAG: hypothetical protein K9J21_06935 [Bacteroidales bacterium]|nr:hypothetical protein [Bacteroidales bacterium]